MSAAPSLRNRFLQVFDCYFPSKFKTNSVADISLRLVKRLTGKGKLFLVIGKERKGTYLSA